MHDVVRVTCSRSDIRIPAYHKNDGCHQQPAGAKVKGRPVRHHQVNVVEQSFDAVNPEDGQDLEEGNENHREPTACVHAHQQTTTQIEEAFFLGLSLALMASRYDGDTRLDFALQCTVHCP